MDKVKYLIVFILFPCFPTFSQAQDSTYIEQYAQIQKFLLAPQDSLSLDSQDLFLMLGMAVICAKDTALEKQVLADRLFSTLSQQVDQKLKNGQLKKDERDFLYLNYVLNQHQYFTPIPVSDSEKLVQYVKEGRFDYIWHRIVGRGYVYYFIGIFITLILLLVLWKRKKRTK